MTTKQIILTSGILIACAYYKSGIISNSISKTVNVAIHDHQKIAAPIHPAMESDRPIAEIEPAPPLSNKYKIVIDAGHGGDDYGCNSSDGTVYEKDVNLAIALNMLRLNHNKNIEIFLTRSDDHFDENSEKAELINSRKADLCVSIHCGDASKNKQAKGTDMYIVNPEKNNGFMNESMALANSVSGVLKLNFANRTIQIHKQGISILQGVNCPILL